MKHLLQRKESMANSICQQRGESSHNDIPSKSRQKGVELYWDQPMNAWPRTPDSVLAMITKSPDLELLLAAAQLLR